MAVSLLLCLSDAHANSADRPLRERGTPANGIERIGLTAGLSASVTHRLGYRDIPDNIYSSLVWTSGMERTLRFHLNGAIDMRSLRSINIIPSIGLALLLPLEAAANGNADASTTGQRDDANRLPKKLAAGVLGGVGGGLLGAAVMLHIGGSSFGWEIPALLGFWGGNLVGTPVGVSAVDPQDNFLVALAGSAMAGIGVPAAVLHLTAIDSDGSATLFFLSAFLGPIVGATTASELSRNPLSPALRSDASKGERIARKLEVGVATGYLLSLLGAGALGIGGSPGGAVLGAVFGSAAGAVVGVISVDPPDRNNNSKSLFLGLAGSSVGAMLSFAVAASRDRWFDSLSTLLCPSIGATIASELWREPPESRRFSIGLVPDPWGRLSTAATLRF